VLPLFDNLTIVEHRDQVGVGDGLQPMSDLDNDAPVRLRAQAVLDRPLGGRIQR
jgi:hypothetical protein